MAKKIVAKTTKRRKAGSRVKPPASLKVKYGRVDAEGNLFCWKCEERLTSKNSIEHDYGMKGDSFYFTRKCTSCNVGVKYLTTTGFSRIPTDVAEDDKQEEAAEVETEFAEDRVLPVIIKTDDKPKKKILRRKR